MENIKQLTDEQLANLEAEVSAAREALSARHKAIRKEIDLRAAVKKVTEMPPAELEALRQVLANVGDIPSAEKFGVLGAAKE